MKKITKEQIFKIASHQEFRVHMFNYRDEHKRKLCRRMCKDGLLIKMQNEHKYFIYRANRNASKM